MLSPEEKKLNKEQLEAIQYGEGPLLIIAGAGTGKTTVITERIKYLITSGLAKPSEILALTFTEKAAKEMEERVDIAMPLGYTQMWISTFHSFCDRVLRDKAIHIGLDPKYKLMTEAGAIMLLRKNLFKLELKYFLPLGNPNKFLDGMIKHFSRLKDEDVAPSEYKEWVQRCKGAKVQSAREEIEKYEELANAYKNYEEIKIKEGVMDFGDLITNTLRLFRNRLNVLKEYQQRFKYILVDEFQDTNFSQNELVLLLAGEKKNLTVVADDDQAIYRFRGAAVSNVIQFRKRVAKAKIVVLTKNYRSTQEILDKAYQLIQNNNPDRLEIKEKIDKRLKAMRDLGEMGDKGNMGDIRFIHADRVENEAEAVAEEIKKLSVASYQSSEKAKHLRGGVAPQSNAAGTSDVPPAAHPGGEVYSYKDIAILVRANNHADSFIRALARHGIPHQFLGPGMLYKQPEVKDLIAYLQVLANFEDSVAMYRVLVMEIFNLSGRDLAAINIFAKKNNLSLFEACEKVEKISLSEKAKETLIKIVKMIHRHLDLIKRETAGQIIYYFLEDTGLLKKLTEYKTTADERKANNIAKLFDKLKTYEVDHEDASVPAVVDWINLSMELGESPLASDIDWTENDAVNILTIHSSKGLEFPVVFLVNLVTQRFPTTERKEQIPIPEGLIKEILPEGDYHLEEERRLFYVGVTRTKDKLYLTAADYYGEGKRERKISPFVYETLGEEAVSSQSSAISPQLSIFDFKSPIQDQPPATSHPARHASQGEAGRQPPVTYLSYSQIETFNVCPLQYKYRYLLRIPTPPSAATNFGSIVHETMRDFYQRAIAGQKPTKDDLLKILDENWSPVGYSSKAQEERLKTEGQKILAGYYQKSYDPKKLPKALEQIFSVKISPMLKIGGKIDRIDLNESGIEIIDYKTGKSSAKKDVENDFQLTVYALVATSGILELTGILEKIYKPEDVKISFYFFDNQEKVIGTRTKEQLEQAKKDLIQKAEEISKSEFSPTPGKMCDFCDYKLLCEAWK